MSEATNVPVGPGTRVTLNFTLSLVNGEIVDGTNGKPATFEVGDGSLLPGFERAMFGMFAGSRATIEIPADQGFGEPNLDNVHMMRRQEFASDLRLESGLVVSFADKNGNSLPGVVKRVYEDRVEVDFNHPLSGRDLLFDIELIEIEQVSKEIARM